MRAQKLIRPEDMPPPERKLELLELTIQRLTAAGYVYIGMDHFSLPEDELTLARANARSAAQLPGLLHPCRLRPDRAGHFLHRQVADSYSQNVKELSQYYARLNDGMLPVHRGYKLSDDDRLRRDVIVSLMCHGRIDYRQIEQKHGIRIPQLFCRLAGQTGRAGRRWSGGAARRCADSAAAGQLMMRNVAMAFDAYLGGEQRGRSRAPSDPSIASGAAPTPPLPLITGHCQIPLELYK